MSKRVDLSGKKFGRLTVLHYSHSSATGHAFYNCLCDCGKQTVVNIGPLKNSTKSCGCYRKEKGRLSLTTHGLSKIPEYRIWTSLKNRCTNQNNKKYPDYGGRGITVCDEWAHSFASFYRDMGPRISNKHTIDRINNNEGYSLGNCRWATMTQQNRNHRNNRILIFNGISMTVVEWGEETGIKPMTIHSRLRRKWSIEKSLTTYLKKNYDRRTC